MTETYNYPLRMPQELGETILKMSKDNRRPMNTQIVVLLESAIREKLRKKKGNTEHNAPNSHQNDAG